MAEQGSYTEPEGVPHSEQGLQFIRVTFARVGVVPLVGGDSAVQKRKTSERKKERKDENETERRRRRRARRRRPDTSSARLTVGRIEFTLFLECS